MTTTYTGPVWQQGIECILRPLTEADGTLVATWVNRNYIRDRTLRLWPIADSREWIQNVHNGYSAAVPQQIVLGIAAQDGSLLGTISMSISWTEQQGTLGIIIGNEEARGRGIGPEATLLLMEFAFNRLGLHALWWHVKEGNSASVRCAQKAGFEEEAFLRNRHLQSGLWIGEHTLMATRESWLPKWEVYQED